MGGEDRSDDAEVLTVSSNKESAMRPSPHGAFLLSLLKSQKQSESRTPAAKAALQIIVYGTAEAVPLSKTEDLNKLLWRSENLK
ncbi:hypothetical protein [Granulicella aggregans]|uniref:hypothetical protein n=1 Tax=Granulicella aggregans TaxID=474949 RepID=UPI0021E03BC5|nr:hypothetical protein [Granulicella aggregans]